jgi:hypothetical protein
MNHTYTFFFVAIVMMNILTPITSLGFVKGKGYDRDRQPTVMGIMSHTDNKRCYNEQGSIIKLKWWNKSKQAHLCFTKPVYKPEPIYIKTVSHTEEIDEELNELCDLVCKNDPFNIDCLTFCDLIEPNEILKDVREAIRKLVNHSE